MSTHDSPSEEERNLALYQFSWGDAPGTLEEILANRQMDEAECEHYKRALSLPPSDLPTRGVPLIAD